ncbi:dihydrodipicolinate synthase family protein [Rhizomonospora bruguierae]|uniref:dihydrodipicolinate synthase family protein n=1 Tax=Rhizomonospora bruguierae TaxID=1581705 RepID=UPI001BCEB41F|nr:dihydrodipicolinate synthase family protein [Micromonospora sp. NBRC 107566]
MRGEPRAFAMSITPFDEAHRLDEAALRRHLRRMVDAGAGVYLGSPGTGEGHALSPAELRKVYEIGVAECKGKVPVYANPPEARTAEQMYARVLAAHEAGVDLVQIYTVDAGHGMRPTAREQEVYYRELLDEVSFPVGLSINTLAGGYVNPVPLLVRLVRDYPQIRCVNVNHPPTSALAELVEELGDRVEYYTDAFMYPEALALGASGCLTGHVNVVPNLIRAIGRLLVRGDAEAGADALLRLFRLNRVVASFGTDALPQNWSGRWVKAAMAALELPGHGDGRMRRPYASPSTQDIEELATALRPLDIPGLEEAARSW